MAQENVVFEQRTNVKGETQFRVRFGRQNTFVFCKHQESGYFYIDIYDNRPGKNDRIGLGLGELDSIIKLRPNMETLNKLF